MNFYFIRKLCLSRSASLWGLGVFLMAIVGLLQAADDELVPLPKIPPDELTPLPKLPPDELTPLPNLTHDSPARFNEVKSWRGSFVASAHSNYYDSGTGYEARNPWEVKINYGGVIWADFLLDEFDDEPAVWSGRVTSANLDASYNSLAEGKTKGGATVEEEFSTNGPVEFSDGWQAKLEFHRERGWSFHINTPRRSAEYTQVTTLKDPPMVIREKNELRVYGLSSTETLPYPPKRLILYASEQKVRDDDVSSRHSVPLTWEYSIYLEPASMEELRLEIDEPAEYATWRPETTPQRDAGATMEVTARLVTASGGKPKARVESFEWELQDTSKEPGVALNFPLDAKDTKFDLELDANGPYFVLSKKNQKMERAIRDGFTDKVKVVPYDWGGWSTLQVTAVLADGRRVSGKLKGTKEYGLRIPKRDKNSHIADGWKKKNGASGEDKVDDEKIAGQKDDGDGYTLYEEYRGWVEDGKHLEGDPKDKDFFVLNLIGADAEPGIDLFASVSQLAVHSKLKPDEMSEEKRLMNGNHREGGRNKDQHGVWVKTFGSKSELGDDGAMTAMNEKGVAGRPGITKGIGILSRDNTESAFNKPFNLTAGDEIFAFDRAIAHELLHSVGVEHHGSGDYRMIVGYASTRNPLNKIGRPYYGTELEKPIDLRTEAGEDVAQREIPEYEKFRKFTDMIMLDRCLKEGAEYIKSNGAAYNPLFSTPEKYADFQIELLLVFCFMHLNGNVGVEHGEHSGAEDCLMRYYFAKFYESKLPPAMGNKMYYLIEPGTEHIGMEICHDGKGTGVNDAGHKPQSRYGDTTADAGNCFEQICPNDAIPPRKVK